MLMNICGFQKSTLIDYPGKLSCILFLAGCNFDCPYCHNPDLVRSGSATAPVISPDQLEAFLARRQGLLDGVVVTGGEPTLQSDLPELCRRIKDMGFSIKLDTNGSRPKVLDRLIAEGLIDYVAMDLKTDPERYAPLISRTCKPETIQASVRTILASGLSHEFRTTCVYPLIDADAVDVMARLVTGAKSHVLQRVQHKNVSVLHPEFFDTYDWFIDEPTLEQYRLRLAEFVCACSIR